jgi:nitric oxide reductase NorE protein
MAHPKAADTAGHVPGEEGIWVLVLGDMTVFVVLFCTYLYYRAQDLAAFQQAQVGLSRSPGLVNTLLLITSSWLVALGVQAVRRADRRAVRMFCLAFACGAGFALVKCLEYYARLRAGASPLAGGYYAFYFVLTGLHLLHLLIGMIVLAFIIGRVRRGAAPPDLRFVESGATYWHMVDLIWVVLFALLYLVR